MADSAVQSLRARVDETIANASSTIQDRVYSHYVDAEIERRSQVIVSGINALREVETDLRKIDRPDQTLFDAAGQPAQALYSKNRLDEVKKGKERLAKIVGALDKAIETNEPDAYNKLTDVVKKGGKPPQRGDGDGDGE